MRTDFHNDRRLQQDASAGAAGGGNFADQNAQWANKYAEATSDSEKAVIAADWYNFRLRAGLLDKGLSSKQALVDAFTQLQTSKAAKSQDLTVRAGEAEFNARQGIIGKHADLKSTEAQSKFNLRLMPIQIQISMLSSIKGMAALIESVAGMFGNNDFKIDTSKLDGMINGLTAKMDDIRMDTSGLDGTDSSISAKGAIRSLDDTTNLAGQDLQGASRQQLDNFVRAMGGKVSPTSTTVSGLTTEQAITATDKMVQNGTLSREQGGKVVQAFSAGAANSLDPTKADSQEDLNLIDQMLARTLANPALREKVEAELKIKPTATPTSGPIAQMATAGPGR